MCRRAAGEAPGASARASSSRAAPGGPLGSQRAIEPFDSPDLPRTVRRDDLHAATSPTGAAAAHGHRPARASSMPIRFVLLPDDPVVRSWAQRPPPSELPPGPLASTWTGWHRPMSFLPVRSGACCSVRVSRGRVRPCQRGTRCPSVSERPSTRGDSSRATAMESSPRVGADPEPGPRLLRARAFHRGHSPKPDRPARDARQTSVRDRATRQAAHRREFHGASRHARRTTCAHAPVRDRSLLPDDAVHWQRSSVIRRGARSWESRLPGGRWGNEAAPLAP